jgi:hypothetical protein
MKTAVEWLIEKLKKIDLLLFEEKITGITYFEEKEKLIIEAKQMFEKQIKDAFLSGDNSDCTEEQNIKEFAKHYYNQTFNK